MKTMKNDFNGNENNRFGNRRFAHGNKVFYKEEDRMRNMNNDFNFNGNRFNGNDRFGGNCGFCGNGRFGNRRFPHCNPEWNRFGRPHFHGENRWNGEHGNHFENDRFCGNRHPGMNPCAPKTGFHGAPRGGWHEDFRPEFPAHRTGFAPRFRGPVRGPFAPAKEAPFAPHHTRGFHGHGPAFHGFGRPFHGPAFNGPACNGPAFHANAFPAPNHIPAPHAEPLAARPFTRPFCAERPAAARFECGRGKRHI